MPNINSEQKKADFVAYNKLTTGLRHGLGIFTRIFKFRSFYETKQTQNEVERFFLQLGRISFRILLRKQEDFSDFCKVFSQFAFHNMIVPFYTSSSACAQAPLHLSHKFFDVKSFYKILPLLPIVIARSPKNSSGICSRHAVFVRRLGGLVNVKKNANRGRGL